jgi:hypothetical protein
MTLPGFDLDAHVREVVAWHFDPRSGSPYWLAKAATLGFDPRREIQALPDLDRFPAVADDWRAVPVTDLIPRGCPGPFDVWESGGTTGPPRRIVDSRARAAARGRLGEALDRFGFPPAAPSHDGLVPTKGHWLHVGPTGPHLVGTNVGHLARMRGALRHTVDLDPRWVKRLYREGRADEARRYAAHVVAQALLLLQTQPVEVLTVTPPLLQALCEHPEAYRLMTAKIRGIIWFGTSMSAETLRLLEAELLPGIPLMGWYGNTLMGIACQRPRRADDAFRCIFQAPSPAAVVRLVDPADPVREVAYGEAGQVRLSVLNYECFLPWHLERDQAVRVKAAEPGPDELAEVAPLDGAGAAVEGVY